MKRCKLREDIMMGGAGLRLPSMEQGRRLVSSVADLNLDKLSTIHHLRFNLVSKNAWIIVWWLGNF